MKIYNESEFNKTLIDKILDEHLIDILWRKVTPHGWTIQPLGMKFSERNKELKEVQRLHIELVRKLNEEISKL